MQSPRPVQETASRFALAVTYLLSLRATGEAIPSSGTETASRFALAVTCLLSLRATGEAISIGVGDCFALCPRSDMLSE
jgi:hypothetical protein